MSTLSAAIIGYGYMGKIRKVEIEKSELVHLSIICEPNEGISINNFNGLIKRNPDDVINSDVDIVFICTPNYLIPDLAIKCLNKKKHVFCEKPPGRNLKDIILMREAESANKDTKLMFGFNHRFHPAILKAKSIVKSNRLGKILAMRGLYGKSGGVDFSNSWRNDYGISYIL